MQIYHHHFNKNLEPSTHASGFCVSLSKILRDTKTLTVLHTIFYFLFLAEGCTNLNISVYNFNLATSSSSSDLQERILAYALFFFPPSSSFSVVVIHSDQLLLSFFLVVYIGSKKEKFQSGVRLQEKEGKQKIGF
jgi:hypothetical protein